MNALVFRSLVAAAMLFAPNCATARFDPESTLSICFLAQHGDARTTYAIAVAGAATAHVVTIAIGRNAATGDPELILGELDSDPQLRVRSSMTSPAGWEPIVISEEEGARVWLEWRRRVAPLPDPAAIGLSGFGVTLTSEDSPLEDSDFQLIMEDGTSQAGRVAPCS